MDYDHYECILAERRGRILTLTLNRPEQLNAVNGRMHDELATIFYDVQKDVDIPSNFFTFPATYSGKEPPR